MTFVLQFKVSCQQFKGVSVIVVLSQGKWKNIVLHLNSKSKYVLEKRRHEHLQDGGSYLIIIPCCTHWSEFFLAFVFTTQKQYGGKPVLVHKLFLLQWNYLLKYVYMYLYSLCPWMRVHKNDDGQSVVDTAALKSTSCSVACITTIVVIQTGSKSTELLFK